jgi:hypothetical protein
VQVCCQHMYKVGEHLRSLQLTRRVEPGIDKPVVKAQYKFV